MWQTGEPDMKTGLSLGKPVESEKRYLPTVLVQKNGLFWYFLPKSR
jgi:hypothetical protein